MKNLRNILKTLLLVVCCLVFTLGLVACDLDSGNNDNNDNDNKDNDHTHVAVADWSYDDKSHWHACEVEGCEEKVDKREHDLDKNAISENRVLYFCETCGYENFVNVGEGEGEGEGEGGGSGSGSGGGGSQVGNGPDWWNSALAMNITDCTQTVEISTDNGLTSVIYLIDEVENVIYNKSTAPNGVVTEGYYIKEGDNYYMYVYVLGGWQRYSVAQDTFELFIGITGQMEDTLSQLAQKYDEFISVDNVWTIENVTLSGEVVDRVTIEFENEQIKSLVLFTEDSTGTATTTVTFEPVDLVLPA